MTSKQYIEEALRTESTLNPLNPERYSSRTARILHAIIGICTEAGELLDAVKKYLFYGKPMDEVNIQEEIGDVFWYLAILCDALGIPFEPIMERNIAKLKARYPQKFASEAAINRDLVTERKALEGGGE